MGCVLLHDTTLRDGEQMPRVVFSYKEKLELAERSAKFGSDFIDIMPSVSETEAKLTSELSGRYPGCVSASCRMKKEEIDLAARCGARQIVLIAPLSDIHITHKLRMTREKVLETCLEMTDYAKSAGLVVDVAGEDSTRADQLFVKEFLATLSGRMIH